MTRKGAEVYDDSRCYLTEVKKNLLASNTYKIFYQKESSYQKSIPKLSVREKMIKRAKMEIELDQANSIARKGKKIQRDKK